MISSRIASSARRGASQPLPALSLTLSIAYRGRSIHTGSHCVAVEGGVYVSAGGVGSSRQLDLQLNPATCTHHHAHPHTQCPCLLSVRYVVALCANVQVPDCVSLGYIIRSFSRESEITKRSSAGKPRHSAPDFSPAPSELPSALLLKLHTYHRYIS